jgi:hypothetical protein
VIGVDDNVRRVGGIALVVALVVFNAWQVANRCGASPPVDWSRLAFGLLLQALVVALWFTSDRWWSQLPLDLHFVAAVFVISFALASCLAVVGAIRFGDKVSSQLWRGSAGYRCPGPIQATRAAERR